MCRNHLIVLFRTKSHPQSSQQCFQLCNTGKGGSWDLLCRVICVCFFLWQSKLLKTVSWQMLSWAWFCVASDCSVMLAPSHSIATSVCKDWGKPLTWQPAEKVPSNWVVVFMIFLCTIWAACASMLYASLSISFSHTCRKAVPIRIFIQCQKNILSIFEGLATIRSFSLVECTDGEDTPSCTSLSQDPVESNKVRYVV